MTPTESKRNIAPFFVDDNKVYGLKGKWFGHYDIESKSFTKHFDWTDNILEQILVYFPLIERVLRKGVHTILNAEDGYLFVKRGKIQKRTKEGKLIVSFADFKGSRPLDICYDPLNEQFLFGEYFSNASRSEPVKVFKSKNGTSWELAWEFEPGQVRHVHRCVYDEIRKGIWVLTGDTDEESGVWFTDDNFKTLTKVVAGSQKARAVDIVPTQTGLIIPMDSPLEKNYIHFYDLEKENFTKVADLPGSAFHTAKIDGIYLVSTITEPSEINKADYACLFASLDGNQWKRIAKLKRDIFPVSLQNYTRYSELMLIKENINDGYIIARPRAIRASKKMIFWKTKQIANFLKE